MTSHDVVARCRKIFKQKRVGHGGTLDPDATGVLLVGLGQATRLLRFLSELSKSYSGEIVLGVSTSTLDAAGEVTGTWDMSGVTLSQVQAAAAALTGDIEQIPPMVSAVKVGGRRLHELAREGIEVERAPRPVTVHRFEVSAGDGPGVFRADVECSSGTFVRTLAADVGTALGGGAHLRALRRTAIGSFSVEDAVVLDDAGPEHVLPAADAMRGRPSVVVESDDVLAAIGHGKVLDRSVLGVDGDGDGPWAVVGAGGRLLAVYEPYDDGRVKPAVVLPLT
jgi:tRNA pseudouridine55 synthase